MYRGKRQSSVSLLKNTFFIEPRSSQRRRRNEISKETGVKQNASTSLLAVAKSNDKQQPIFPKNPFPKETDFSGGETDLLTEKKVANNQISGGAMQQADGFKDISNSNENNIPLSTYCSNFDLSLSEATMDGVNYYNMTVC